MPQMAPINWLWLFFIFLLTFLMFNMMIYFIYTPKIKKIISNPKASNLLIWKW